MLWVKLIDIHPNPNNPRTINADKFAKLKRSLIEFPEMLTARPLVCVTSDFGGYTILGGNMRYKALCDIEAAEVPIILADEWTLKQRDEFLIKDNLSFGDWDWEELANSWDAVELIEWGMTLPEIKDEEKPEKEMCPTCGK